MIQCETKLLLMETETAPTFFLAARDGDTVRKILSTAGAQSWIDYQDALRDTPIIVAAAMGHEAVTKQLIEAHCNVDLQMEDGCTPFYLAAGKDLFRAAEWYDLATI